MTTVAKDAGKVTAEHYRQQRRKSAAERGTPFPGGNKLTATFKRWEHSINAYNDRQTSKPDSWVALKFAVGLTFALLAYCYYVYVGRACVPMIRGDPGRRGGKVQGIIFLVIFNLLWLLVIYTYLNIILTGPGFAKDHVPQEPCPEPPFPVQPPSQPVYGGGPTTDVHRSFQVLRHPQQAHISGSLDPSHREGAELSRPNSDSTLVHESLQHRSSTADRVLRGQGAPNDTFTQQHTYRSNDPLPKSNVQEPFLHIASVGTTEEDRVAEKHAQKAALGPGVGKAMAGAFDEEDGLTGQGATMTATATTTTTMTMTGMNPAQQQHSHSAQGSAVAVPGAVDSALPSHAPLNDMGPSRHGNDGTGQPRVRKVFREPPMSLPLHPYSRYCSRCEIVKPLRAHHCRHCGTCVLGMDHHCPWIGQCVGSRNHVYFVSFCFWTCICLAYVFVTLLITLIAPGVRPRPRPAIDGQILAICILSWIFAFFTGSMGATHVRLIMLNQSTIENMTIQSHKHRELARLHREYGFWEFRAKREEHRAMDLEWGDLDRELNLFYTGDRNRLDLLRFEEKKKNTSDGEKGQVQRISTNWSNWEAVMGTKVLAWFIPPPRYRPDDGLDYPVNPRRGPNGEWRRRSEWPRELQ